MSLLNTSHPGSLDPAYHIVSLIPPSNSRKQVTYHPQSVSGYSFLLRSSCEPFVGAGVQSAVEVSESVSLGPVHRSAETTPKKNNENQKEHTIVRRRS